MGYLSRLMGTTETREHPSANIDWATWLGGGSTVTPTSALQLATVFACVRVLSESVASLPLVLYARLERGKRRAPDHPLYFLLHDLPNPEMSSIELRIAMMGHLTLYGNAYAQIVRDRGGRVQELWPLSPPDAMQISRENGRLVYTWQPSSARPTTLRQEEVLHVRGLSSEGLVGLSPISTARRRFETATSMSSYSEAYYANGATPGGLLKHPGTLGDKAYERLRQSWELRHQGTANANRVAILEEGMDYAPISVPQTDQQFIEQEKLTQSQIAAVFRVPGHMVNDLERATFSNIEQMSLEFVMYTLRPWLVQWEQAISRSLLLPAERSTYFAEHLIEGLLRGDTQSRYQAYAMAIQHGWMNRNEIREIENLNPFDGGDEYLVPLNMGGANDEAEPDEEEQRSLRDCTCGGHRERRTVRADEDDETEDLRLSRVEMALAELPVLEDIAARLVRREARDVSRAIDKFLRKRSEAQFREWLGEFYFEFDGVVADAFRPALLSYARQGMLAAASELKRKPKGLTDGLREFVSEYVDAMSTSWAASSRRQLEALLDEAPTLGEDPVVLLDERLAGWEETQAEKVADHHAFEALNAFVIASYAEYGVKRLRWVASGESCPFCRALDGRIVGIESFFVDGGSAVDGGDGQPPMLVRRNTRHGPLHGGCDCVVVAA